MMRRNLIYLLVFGLMVSSGQLSARPRDGLYICAGIGASLDESELTAKNTVNGFTVEREPDKTHALGCAFLGYGCTLCDCFFLGLEAGTYFPSRTLSQSRPGVALTTFTFRNHLSVQDYFTVDVLPGFRICPDILLYLRGGGTVSHLELKQDGSAAAAVPSFENCTTKWGGRVGAGLNYAFCQNLSIGLDYIYSCYSHVTTDITGFDTRVKATVDSHYIGVSLIYNFPLCCW